MQSRIAHAVPGEAKPKPDYPSFGQASDALSETPFQKKAKKMADLCDEVLKQAAISDDSVLMADVNEDDPFLYEPLEVSKIQFKYDRLDHYFP